MENKKKLANLEKEKNIRLLLLTYKGIGKGIWNINTQQRVSDLRKDRKSK